MTLPIVVTWFRCAKNSDTGLTPDTSSLPPDLAQATQKRWRWTSPGTDDTFRLRSEHRRKWNERPTIRSVIQGRSRSANRRLNVRSQRTVAIGCSAAQPSQSGKGRQAEQDPKAGGGVDRGKMGSVETTSQAEVRRRGARDPEEGRRVHF